MTRANVAAAKRRSVRPPNDPGTGKPYNPHNGATGEARTPRGFGPDNGMGLHQDSLPDKINRGQGHRWHRSRIGKKPVWSNAPTSSV